MKQSAPHADAPSPWLLVPVFSSSPKLGTAVGGLGGYLRTFDPESRVSIFGVTYQQLLKTDDDLKAAVARYVFRTKGDWFIGVQGTAANYQLLGATPEDDLVLETLGVLGFKSAALGAVIMHDSRDNEDMPTTGWLLNINNLAHREALGGSTSFDAYHADARLYWKHGGNHVLAVRQFNWLTSDAPIAALATVILRGYKLGQYLAGHRGQPGRLSQDWSLLVTPAKSIRGLCHKLL